MTPVPGLEHDITRLLQSGKHTRLEWIKQNMSRPKIAEILAAMANGQGGTLIVGLGPTGKIEGVSSIEKATDHVLEAALSLEPALIIPMPKPTTIEDKTLLVVSIPAGMPNVYGLDGRYVRRVDTRNIGLKPSELRRMMIERGVTSFESEMVPSASLEDIDWAKAKKYASTLPGMIDQDTETVLMRRGCIVKFNGVLRPTHAGILLFGKEPQRFIRGSEITAARFAGEMMGDIFNREDIVGTLPEQIRRAEAFLADHLRKGVQLSGKMERSEQLEYPMEAARELVVNAVAHRDYSITGDGIRLFIFRDHMEVSNPGGLAGPVTVANIKDERFSRNPVIVQVLADMRFIERLGYGVDRVMNLMAEAELPLPEFTETAGGFRVMLHQRSLDKTEPASDAAPITANYKDIELNPRQQVAMDYLKQGHDRITNSDLQNLCPDVHPETIRRDLADLVTRGLLVKRGQKRGSHYTPKTEASSEENE